jgi:hypothetical protein
VRRALRFEPLPETDGVLDRTTGLVWERKPAPASLGWNEATGDAGDGWRLPTIGELSDLAAALVLGHPFEPAAPEGVFWTSSESPFKRQHDVRGVAFDGDGGFAVVLLARLTRARRWRVRPMPNGRCL